MTQFTLCPGTCENKVAIMDGDTINYCCVNCWNWYFHNGIMNSVPLGEDGQPLPAHSEQCNTRQMSRIHEEVILDRQFQIRTKS
jgi:hypothetical protein